MPVGMLYVEVWFVFRRLEVERFVVKPGQVGIYPLSTNELKDVKGSFSGPLCIIGKSSQILASGLRFGRMLNVPTHTYPHSAIPKKL